MAGEFVLEIGEETFSDSVVVAVTVATRASDYAMVRFIFSYTILIEEKIARQRDNARRNILQSVRRIPAEETRRANRHQSAL